MNEFKQNLEYIKKARKENLSDTQIRDKLSIDYSDEYIDNLFSTDRRKKYIIYGLSFAMLFLFAVAFFLGAPKTVGNVVLGVDNYAEEPGTFYSMVFIVTCALFAAIIITLSIFRKIFR